MKSVLVLTDETEVGAHVTTRVHELHSNNPDLEVFVLVPASKSVALLRGGEVDGLPRANQQLSDALELFESIGIRATGAVGGHDPMEATRQVLSKVQPDLILVSTLPGGLSRWLNMDLPHRLRRRFGIAVEDVMGIPVNDNDWNRAARPIEGPIRVLLVEDSADEAALMRYALADSAERIDLSVVNNGAEAVDLLRRSGQDNIDLVLLDLRMPVIDGHEFLEIVGEDFDVDALNVTVVTSSTSTEDRVRAHALGAGAYVIKDPDIEVFTESIHSILEEVANG